MAVNIGDLVAYESGDLTPRETVELFGQLVATGLAWTLQGSYGRTATRLIHDGYLTPDGEVRYADHPMTCST